MTRRTLISFAATLLVVPSGHDFGTAQADGQLTPTHPRRSGMVLKLEPQLGDLSRDTLVLRQPQANQSVQTQTLMHAAGADADRRMLSLWWDRRRLGRAKTRKK